MPLSAWYLRRGRIDRSTFWLRYYLPIIALGVVAQGVDAAFDLADDFDAGDTVLSFATAIGPISTAVVILTIVPTISSIVCRLHDRDHSAAWLLFYLLPVIGWIVLVVTAGFLPGQPHPNRYGPPPGSSARVA